MRQLNRSGGEGEGRRGEERGGMEEGKRGRGGEGWGRTSAEGYNFLQPDRHLNQDLGYTLNHRGILKRRKHKLLLLSNYNKGTVSREECALESWLGLNN